MSATPDWVGQVYKDTNNGNLWRSNSTTPGDWTLELQNMQVQWEPTNLKLGNMVGYFTYSDLSGITKLTFLGSTSLAGFNLSNLSAIQVEFPNLVSIDPTNIQGGWVGLPSGNMVSISAPNLVTIAGEFYFPDNANLTSISMPSLVSSGGACSLQGCTSLMSFSLPSLVTMSAGFDCSGCSSLNSVNLPSFLPTSTKNYDFLGCALNAASVNHLLARCVANAGFVLGLIRISGGTNAAPTGQGIIDKATLNARHAGLAVTN